MDRGNRAIRDHVDQGRMLRVFGGVRGTVTYSGEFTLDPIEPYYVARAPETGGGPVRDVFMFKLVPVGQSSISESLFEPADIAPTMGQSYLRADETVVTDPGEIRVPEADVYNRGLRGHRSTQNVQWVRYSNTCIGSKSSTSRGISPVPVMLVPSDWYAIPRSINAGRSGVPHVLGNVAQHEHRNWRFNWA